MIRYRTPVGILAIVASERKLLMCDWIDSKLFGRHFEAVRHLTPDSSLENELVRLLDCYFAAEFEKFSQGCEEIELAPCGTPFQKVVWQQLLTIPLGITLSYSLLARAVNSHPRAVASAVARNPVSVFIPCHRVIGADSSLTGYAGGLDAKRFLLRHETTVNKSCSPEDNSPT